MVLAIGIVVDDAIVVVEAVEHNMQTARPLAARGDPQGDGRGAGPGGCDRAGARGGVHPDGLHPGRDRAALQAVRDHGGGVDDVLGAGRADAHAGAVRDAAQAARARRASRRPAGRLLRVVQPRVRPDQRALWPDRGPRGAPRAGRARDPRRRDPRDRRAAAHHADRLRSGRGQGCGVHAGHPAGGRLAATHGRGCAAGAGDRARDPRRRRVCR